MGERIAQAAIRHAGTIYTLPRPARHADLFKANCTVENGIIKSSIAAGEQGFVTDSGRFVDRKEAWGLAQATEQLLEGAAFRRLGPTLYTEDMW